MLPENIFENQFPSINNAYMSTILERNKELSKCCKMDEILTGEIYPIGNKGNDVIVDPEPGEILPGSNLKWIIDEDDNTLYISGTGTMPNSISGAWKDYYGTFTKVVIADGVTTIGSNAFRECSDLVEIVLPNTIQNIGSSAFENCTSLVNITIPDSVSYIGSAAFQYCTSLVEIVIPDLVKGINAYTFRQCRSLVKVTIGNSVTTILGYAFANCNNLVEIVISDSVTRIVGWAFAHCTNLLEIIIPYSVTTIETCAFQGCTKLKKITNYALTPQNIGSEVFQNVNKNTCVVEVPTSSLTLYQVANNWKDFQNIIGI